MNRPLLTLVEILTRTGDDSLARHLFGLNSGNRNELSRSSMLVMELQGILIDVLRASDEWIRELVQRAMRQTEQRRITLSANTPRRLQT